MRRIWFVILFLSNIMSASAQQAVRKEKLDAHAAEFIHEGDSVQLIYELDFSKLTQVDKDNILLIRNRITADDNHQLELPSIGIYGRNPYYFYYRSEELWLQHKEDIMFRAGEHPPRWKYSVIAPYADWMNNCQVEIEVSDNNYCEGQVVQQTKKIFEIEPQIVKGKISYEVKRHTVTGNANVDYVVNITKLDPEYHNNTAELQKIRTSIDSVRRDSANQITRLYIKGWASPEGPYWNNIRLAKGRSESLRDYVSIIHGIDPKIMHVDFEPEDWVGFRKMVEESNLKHKKEIIDIIDDTQRFKDPDQKLDHIRKNFRREWDRIIYPKMMPYLRHTEYAIEYEEKERVKSTFPDDTIYKVPTGMLKPTTFATLPARRLTWALKTNLLFDAIAAFNFEVEVAFGKHRDWSIMVEDWFPWYVWHHNSRAYEVWNVGVELRKWKQKCYPNTPFLTGRFWGVYLSSGKYDIEWGNSHKGEQGEYISFGATYGKSWPIAKNWNFEASASLGIFFGPQRHYHGEFDDTHLIWKENRHFFYAGPTKLKLSIVWLLPDLWKKKGGGR